MKIGELVKTYRPIFHLHLNVEWRQTSSVNIKMLNESLNSRLSLTWRTSHVLIETLYRENVSFRDRDLKRQIPCHTASKNLDAQLLRNDTSFLSNLLCKSPLINYSPTIFVRLFQPIHWYETRILTFSSEKRAPISTMFTCRASHNVL